MNLKYVDYPFKITIFAIALLVILKIMFSNNLQLILFTSLFEISIFILILEIYYTLLKLSKNKIISKVIFYILYGINLIISIINGYFLEDLFVRQESILELNFGIIRVFFQEFLSIKFLICLILFFVITFLILYFIKFKSIVIKKKLSIIIVSVLIILIMPFMTNFSHPYTNMNFYKTQQILAPSEELPLDFSQLNFEFNDYFDINSRYSKIFVFVMEESPYYMFNADIDKIDYNNNFFKQLANKTNNYSNYYTTDQDSRIALFAMLSSVFVPYESYSDSNWFNIYGKKILSKKNLVEFFKKNDFNTYFFISDVNVAFEMKYYPWTGYGKMEDKDFYDTNYVCVKLLEYQKGCEDEILMNQLKNVAKQDQVFVYQEFVYGHGQQYITKKGLSRPAYYNNYLLEFYNYLIDEDMFKDSLIIVVSDHGLKGTGPASQIKQYQVPFLVIANDLNNYDDKRLFNHLNFKDILLHYLTGSDLNSLNKSFFIGTTQTNYIGFVKENQSYAIINNSSSNLVSNKGLNLEEISGDYNFFLNYKQFFDHNC